MTLSIGQSDSADSLFRKGIGRNVVGHTSFYAKMDLAKEYVSLIIGLYKNNGSVLHVIISFLLIGPLYPVIAC